MGHKAFDFPAKVNLINVEPQLQSKYILDTIGTRAYDITLDTCAEVSCVDPSFVKADEYIETTKLIKGIHGEAKQKPMGLVNLGVGRYEVELTMPPLSWKSTTLDG